MKNKKSKWIIFFAAVCLFLLNRNTVLAEETSAYEKYFQFKKFNSGNGLDGSSVNCVLASKEGFLWIGGYSGLQRYDGTEFKNYQINGKTLPVNDIEQDAKGTYWIATNGEGLYTFDGKEFTLVDPGEVSETAYTINKILVDSSDKVWVGTKEGLYIYDGKLKVVETLSAEDIISITEIEKGKIIVITKAGNIYLIKDNVANKINIPELDGAGKPRCCVKSSDYGFLIGTSGEQILELDMQGQVEHIYEDLELKCINSMYELKEGTYWVCTDSGIGMLEEGNLKKLDIPLTDSVEEACIDYEGNYWFVSSRQGILQVFENMFSNLGMYLGIEKTVNSIEYYQDELYVGCDDGIYCFRNKEPVDNNLTQSCKGDRIRQIYKDREDQLWVSTYYHGLKVMDANGLVSVLNTDNSGLKTNQIRCTCQRKNGDMLVGTEQGVYLINKEKKVSQLLDDKADLNNIRVLDVREAEDGKIYATTDGHGVYVIQDDAVEKVYTKQQGLLSNIVMKVVPSQKLHGTWFVSGIGINFLSEDGKITEIRDIGMSNVLSMNLIDNGDALVYASNGLFRLKESDLLNGRGDSLVHYKRQDGLPIDFTANAWNCIHDQVLYMCGSDGIASIDLTRKSEHPDMKVYIYNLQMDGKNLEEKDGKYILPSRGYRLTIDVRCINYIYKDYNTGYYMEGTDQSETIIENGSKSEISYTNLKGGDYEYHFRIFSPDNGECLGEIVIPMHKMEKMIERPEVQVLLFISAGLIFAMCIVLLLRYKEKRINRQLAIKYQKEKEEMMERLAYRDMVTGVYNRNLFEEDKKEMNMEQVTAVVLFSVNHIRYIEQKLGVLQTGEILRCAVEIAGKCQEKQPKIYRLSENVVCLVFFEPIELDRYIMTIKEEFLHKGEERKLRLSLAVGGIYNNQINQEDMDSLIRRCEEVRLMDEKKAEAEFVKGKINIL